MIPLFFFPQILEDDISSDTSNDSETDDFETDTDSDWESYSSSNQSMASDTEDKKPAGEIEDDSIAAGVDKLHCKLVSCSVKLFPLVFILDWYKYGD